MVLSTNQAALDCVKIMSTECHHIRIWESQVGPAVHFLDLNIQVLSRRDNIAASSCFNTSLYGKPCDLRGILHMNYARGYSVEFGTIFSQLVRIWRLCTNQQEACREIGELLCCVRASRGLRPRTVRRVINRFLTWVCKDLIGSNSCKPKSPSLLCTPPCEVNSRRMVEAVTERLCEVEKTRIGAIRLRYIICSRLGHEPS